MAQRDRAKLRVVEAGRLSAEDMLRMAEPEKKLSKLDVWLSQQEEHTSRLFWETMALAKERGKPFDAVYRIFMANFADGHPPLGCRWAKTVVDARLDNR